MALDNRLRNREAESAAKATPDETAIRAAAAAVADVEADLAVQRAQLHAGIVALLTPDQRQQLQTLRAERDARQVQSRK